MARRIETIELAIQHVGQQGHWMPVRHDLAIGKGPHYRVTGKSFLNVRVLGDVPVIVEIDEIERDSLGVNRQTRYQQEQTDQEASIHLLFRVPVRRAVAFTFRV